MNDKRFVLVDDYDEGVAIRDTTKAEGHDILIVLPVFIWALEPLVDLMNELHEAAQSK